MGTTVTSHFGEFSIDDYHYTPQKQSSYLAAAFPTSRGHTCNTAGDTCCETTATNMEEDTSKCVVVRGFPIVDGEQLESLKDKLQIYFQSTKDSGGGDVHHLKLVEPGLIEIQFVEGEATKNVLSRTNHQINAFGKDYLLDVLPYRPAHDAGQPAAGPPAGSNRFDPREGWDQG
ncbi:Hypp1907 [Branchiostoma lanceolatum]|uniref:Hypp1907 protein n=1 Tax=Branchiostoma lanceolatum TaxID=7740 RepID=A0A8K0ER01_BRALA|nr:Hypp1907 [Branchiostoma lanceolatum]